MTKQQALSEIVRLAGKIEYSGPHNLRLVWFIGVLISLLAEVMSRDSLYAKIVLKKLKRLANEPERNNY